MIDSLSFLRGDWLVPVLLCGIGLWVVFLWKAATAGRKRFLLNAVIGLLAIGALVLLILQPQIPKDVTKNSAVILTQSYTRDQLDSLESVHKGLIKVMYDGEGFDKGVLDQIDQAFVLGRGVAPYDFWQLENIKTKYVDPQPLSGILRLAYNQEMVLGDSLQIKGLYSKPKVGTTLLLRDPGGNDLDSVQIETVADVRFDLRTSPKAKGRFLYKLVEKDSTGAIALENPIPLVVKPRKQLRILIVNTFPTFETKYLKNFLASQGHEMLVRSQLTKDTYKFENLNRKQGTIYGFTAANLSYFDLVIIDASSFLGLSRTSRRALESQVESEGLGVFIQPDGTLLERGGRFGFRFKRNTIKNTQIAPWPKVSIAVYSASFQMDKLSQPIVSSGDNVWSAYRQKGNGRMGSSLFQDTYQLLLDGQEMTYAYIWTKILSAISQRDLPSVSITSYQQKSYVDEPYKFTINTPFANPELRGANGDRIGLRQHLQLKDQWSGTVIPKKVGWNEFLFTNDSIALPYYVFANDDWPSMKSYETYQANKHTFTGATITTVTEEVLEPFSSVWFFVVFMLCIGMLWLEPRV